MLKNTKFWLLAIATGLIAIHLTITWKKGYTDLFGLSMLFWLTVGYLIWQKRTSLSFKTGIVASTLGTIIIAFVLIANLFYINRFSYISPFLSALGLALLVSGFRGLKQYYQELLILVFPAVANVMLLFVFNLPELTAKFVTFVLWYLGFVVRRDGVYIALKTGMVEVNPGCSGQENILHLLVLTVLFLALFPPRGRKKFIVPVVAVFIGFVVNGLRVTLLTILVNYSNQKAFDYWHNGDGSLIFSLISVLIFGSFCLLFMHFDEPKKKNNFLKYCVIPPKE